MDTRTIYIKGLMITSPQKKQTIDLVKGVDLTLHQGEILGIVGESGSGKSLTMKTLLGIVPSQLRVEYDRLEYEGKPISEEKKLPISMIFQDPMSSLNPLRKIGYHLEEVVKRFEPQLDKKARREKILDMLERVRISQPEERLNQYPFEFSGGMRQRILIAMALLANPKVLIADEPTTALDVTIQAQILALLKDLQESFGLTVILVSHDFGVVASLCDRVVVMRQGEIVEEGAVEDIFEHPSHPYTQQLLQAARLETPVEFSQPSSTDLDGEVARQFVGKGGD